METKLNWIEIERFKSIKKLRLECKRINVFVGEPNVGKSNILEAISFLSSCNSFTQNRFLSEFVSYEKVRNLIYDNDRSTTAQVHTNLGSAFLKYHMNSIDRYDVVFGPDREIINFQSGVDDYNLSELKKRFNTFAMKFYSREIIDSKIPPMYFTIRDNGNIGEGQVFDMVQNQFIGIIKKYTFKKDVVANSKNSGFLKVPYGENIFMLLESNSKLFEEASELFSYYHLDLLFDTETEKLEIQKRINKKVYKIPYALCADTLQRFIFHLAAIRTNSNSVILFEEPEAHSFPPYISRIANEIIEDDKNQYFIATHSPYILRELIGKCPLNELQINICNYKDNQTVSRPLTNEEIQNISETNVDFFYELRAFQQNDK